MKAWTRALLITLMTPFFLAGLFWVFCIAGVALAGELMSELADWADSDAR